MKRFHVRTVFIVGSSLLLPALVMAANFQGPSQSPPNGNVPGVIWNEFGTGQTQPNADIRISGGGSFGGDLSTSSTKAIRVDQNGAATYYMGNWGGAGGAQKPLTYYINGDIQVSDLGLPLAQGNRGRVQATEYCFNPGTGPSDCISAWPGSGGGLYVLKTGDSMSGQLDANAGIDVLTNFRYTNSLGEKLQSGGWQGPPNQGFLEVIDTTGNKRLRLLNITGEAINTYINQDSFPGAGGAHFDSFKTGGNGGLGSTNFWTTPAGGISASFDTNVPGSPVSGYIGYCPPGTPCTGISITANGGKAGATGLSASHTSGTSMAIAGADYAGLFYATAPFKNAAAFVNLPLRTEVDLAPATGLGIYASGSNTGIQSLGSQSGIISTGGTYGIQTTGGSIGVKATGQTAGEFNGVAYGVSSTGATAILARGTNYGLEAYGTAYGISSQGNIGANFVGTVSYGITADGPNGSYFSGGPGYTTYLAYPGYGVWAGVPNNTIYGLYTNGKGYIGGTLNVLTDLTVGGAATIANNLTVNGNLSVPGNTLSSCAWSAYVANGTAITCPAANPLMSGFQSNAGGTQMRAYCCDL